ncbi:MAG: T9SS type B sorting domain-containing protein [Sphingobacteriales bacterium]|nr:MAG: T9SS type B sorting domain-containing protein [Sphingobacteriales bacterium]
MKYVFPIFLLALVFNAKLLLAQGEGNVWYFGSKAGINFSTFPPKALTDGALTTNEGCATISDKAGKLLFYTDGIKVWNSKHKLMPNGNGLAGDPSSTQSGIIVPKPLYPNVYYVFTVDKEAQKKGFQYSEVDMTLDSGRGDVTIKNKPIAVPVSEKLTAVQHKNKKDIWVIVHEWNSKVFRAYLVDEKGFDIAAPVISETGYWHGGDFTNSIGYLKASSNGEYLASIISREKNNIELFNFDNETGKILKKLSVTGIENPYGVEFSPDVSKLYTGSKNLAQLYQIDLLAGDSNAIKGSNTLIADLGVGLSLGAFQLGPDGKIYVSRAGSTKLSVINKPNLKGLNCNYDPEGIDLKGRSCLNGLPTFIQSFFIPLTGFSYDAPCVGMPVNFYGVSNVIPDSWKWDFGDPGTPDNFSSSQNATHTYYKTGRYRVEIVTGKGGLYDTVIQYVDIPPKPNPNLGKDMLRCIGEKVQLDAGPGNKYLWSTGDTLQVIYADTTGKYWVRVSNIACQVTDSVNLIFVSEEDMKLGNDTTVCEGTTLILRSKLSGAKYYWATGSRDSAIKATRSGKYWLQTVVGDCSVRDTMEVNFLPPPTVNLGKDSMVCEGDDVILDAKNPGSTYLWSNGEQTQQITINCSGKFWVKVSGGDCFASDTILFYACKSNVLVPNAFTPDRNGVNDNFRIYGTDIYKAQLTITNRWGEIIFRTNDIYKGWDGKFKGAKCPVGQYFWNLDYWEYEGDILYPKQKKGAFNLINQ